MWHWQQNGPRRYYSLSHVVKISAGVHLLALIAFFIMYRGGSAFTIAVGKNVEHARVVLLPLYKIVPACMQPARSMVAAVPEHAVDAPQAVPEKKPEVAPKRAPTSLATHRVTVKKANKKNKQKKVAQKKKQKQTINKKQKPQTKKLKAEPVKPIPTPELKPTVAAPQVEQPLNTAVAVEDDVVYVGQLEYDALKLQEALQTEVERCWQSPPGVQDINCQIKVILDFKGHPHVIDIQNSSGVLMYDLSAREAVAAMAFPSIAWGKEITITFTC